MHNGILKAEITTDEVDDIFMYYVHIYKNESMLGGFDDFGYRTESEAKEAAEELCKQLGFKWQ